jgi:DNA-binding PadR family transcriptional regulator
VSKNPIRTFEKQSGLIRLLIYLFGNQPINIQAIIDSTDIYPNIMYPSIRKAVELGLVKSKIDSSSYPPKNMISLTDKGKKVAKLLKDIEEVLEEGK